MAENCGAGEGNRTLVVSLGSLRRPAQTGQYIGFLNRSNANGMGTLPESMACLPHFYRRDILTPTPGHKEV